MARMSLPPGFRFHPTDVELVMYYLKRKVMGKKLRFEAISEVNIYKFSPRDLPDKSCLKSKDLEWYFFCPRERKYASGSRMNRATETGYWKTTGKDRPVIYENSSVGMVKTLVFHQGNAPRGQRTDWVIHEYRIENKNLADLGVAQDAYVLCKVFHKSGPGPKNGAQYGAPFKEEEWDDDDEDFPVDSLLPGGPSPVVPALPENLNTAAAMSTVDLGNATVLSLNEPGPYLVETSNNEGLLDGQDSSMVTSVVNPGNSSGCSLSKPGLSSAGHSAHDMILDTLDDDIVHLLASFSDDNPFFTTGDENNEILGDLDHGKAKTIPNPDGNNPFNGLEDLSNFELNEGGDTRDIGCNAGSVLLQDDTYLELDDLAVPLNLSSEYCVTEQMETSGLYGPCNSSGSGGNFSSYDSCLTDFLQFPMMPDLPQRQVNSNNVFHTLQGNVHHSTNAAYNLDFTYRQQEEIRNSAGKLGRGVQQRQIFSRLQQLLESIPADPASAAYDGSSIHVKAEVTYRFTACTKDALSVMLEEVHFCLYLLVGPPWDRISEITGRLQHGVCSCFV